MVMNKPGKIMVYYAWGRRNAGDHALILGALELLSHMVDLRDVVVVSRYGESAGAQSPVEDIRQRFPDVEIVPGPFDLSIKKGWARIAQFAQALVRVVGSLLWPRWWIRKAEAGTFWHALGSARVVVLNGGNLFFWHKVRRNFARLAALSFPLLLARRLGITYGMFPQTCGPFEGPGCWWIGRLFERAGFLTFRDSDSLAHAKTIAQIDGVPHALVPDLAFFLTPREGADDASQALYPEDGEKGFFCVCLRTYPLGWDVTVAQDNPEETERKILALLPPCIAEFQQSTGAHCLIVVQADVDRDVSAKLQHALQQLSVACSIVELTQPYDFVNQYRHALFLLSFRLHSIIFALSQGTPAIGIWRRPLGTKLPSMMHDLDLDEYAIELDDAHPESLLNSMHRVYRERESLRASINALLASRKSCELDFFRGVLLPVIHVNPEETV